MFPLKDNIPTERTPVVTIIFIAINLIAYFILQKKTGIDLTGNSLDQGELVNYGAIPYEFTHPGDQCGLDAERRRRVRGPAGVRGTPPDQLPLIATVFTSMFTHGGLLHLGGNMLFLWIFGNNVEDAMGPVRFVAFYVLGGVAALLGQIIVGPDAAVPTLGASGAVAGVLGGYLLMFPRARVLTLVFIVLFFTVIELPAILFLGFWFLQQILFGTHGPDQSDRWRGRRRLLRPHRRVRLGPGDDQALRHIVRRPYTGGGPKLPGVLTRTCSALVLGGGLIFVAILGVLTVAVLIDTGPDVLTLTSLVIIALLGFGLYSAMRGPGVKRARAAAVALAVLAAAGCGTEDRPAARRARG